MVTRDDLIEHILYSELEPAEKRDLILAVRKVKIGDVLDALERETGRRYARQSVYQTKAGARSARIERVLARLAGVEVERLFAEHYGGTG